MATPRRAAGIACVALLAAVAGCSSSAATVATTGSGTQVPATAATTGTGPAATEGRAAAGVPRVDLVVPAVQALEAKLGAPQKYFEINATAHLVNVIVSLNNGAFAQNWLYLDGELSSKEPQPAAGYTFAASALNFDPAAVLDKITGDLPDATPNLFLVEGGPQGVVRYTVVVTSSKGGQLLVVVGADGKVIEVDPD